MIELNTFSLVLTTVSALFLFSRFLSSSILLAKIPNSLDLVLAWEISVYKPFLISTYTCSKSLLNWTCEAISSVYSISSTTCFFNSSNFVSNFVSISLIDLFNVSLCFAKAAS